jgi:hypothetical protein
VNVKSAEDSLLRPRSVLSAVDVLVSRVAAQSNPLDEAMMPEEGSSTMTDASEGARSELIDAALPLEGTGDLELVGRAAKPNDPARDITLAARPILTVIWLPADENRRDKVAVQDVRRPGWEAGGLLALINGVAGAIAGAYVATRSVPVTALAGGAALLLAVLVVWRNERHWLNSACRQVRISAGGSRH